MNKTFLKIGTAAMAVMLFVGCDHKELCFDHDEHALKYHAEIEAAYTRVWQWTQPGETDWEKQWPLDFDITYQSLIPGFPKGLRTVVYADGVTARQDNIDTFGGEIALAAGRNDILFYNNDTEYIVFSGLGSMATASATTRSRTRPSYKGSPFCNTRGEVTVNAPDMLYGSSVVNYFPEKTQFAVPLKVSMTPLVFTYYVRLEFKSGLKYVALARGALAGMAEGVNLYSGNTSDNRVTVMFDADLQDYGVSAAVRSFGVPGFPNSHYGSGTRADYTYGLNLEVRLRNGKIKTFDFDVTQQIQAQPQGGVIVIKGLEITDSEGQGGSSGFDVDVEGWGEYEDIPITFPAK